MMVHWGSDGNSNRVNCDHCGLLINDNECHIDVNGVTKSCDKCQFELTVIENRNNIIDNLIDKKWWEFWK